MNEETINKIISAIDKVMEAMHLEWCIKCADWKPEYHNTNHD